MRVDCKLYRDIQSCLKNPSCGWCGQENNCIMGNSLGPLESCPKSTYVFSWPFPGYEQRNRVVEHDLGGITARIFTRK